MDAYPRSGKPLRTKNSALIHAATRMDLRSIALSEAAALKGLATVSASPPIGRFEKGETTGQKAGQLLQGPEQEGKVTSV